MKRKREMRRDGEEKKRRDVKEMREREERDENNVVCTLFRSPSSSCVFPGTPHPVSCPMHVAMASYEQQHRDQIVRPEAREQECTRHTRSQPRTCRSVMVL